MLDLIKEKWDDILLYIEEEFPISSVSVNTFLKPCEPYFIKGDVVYILSPDSNPMMIKHLTDRYPKFFQVAIKELTDLPCSEVKFISDASDITDVTGFSLPNNKEALSPYGSEQLNLNPKYTFDTFVIGANNKFAHAASLAVAESPAECYNPLFIYGGVGLGKTHLMHSIAHFIKKNNPKSRVVYVSSEVFTNELIDAIRTKNNITLTEFREKYRNIDVLLIDDIQFIIGKESTQEEFFHTFNLLYESNKQVVISADKPPRAFETLEERLRSRFEMGLTVDISAPDYETRMAILRRKEEVEGLTFDNSILQYIATNIKSNIRELEGALTKLSAYSKLNMTDITLEVAEIALKDQISPDEQREISVDYIIDVVAEHFNLRSADLASTKRTKDLVYPRQIAMYLCRQLTNESLHDIAIALGKKDHTTVIHGINTIEKDMKNDEVLRGNIDILKKKILPS